MASNRADAAALLTPEEMRAADRQTMASGTPGIVLMERAAEAVRDAALGLFPEARRIAFLAGPGNNGGDGFAAARLLRAEGRAATVFSLKETSALEGDAGLAAAAWHGPRRPLDDFDPTQADLVVDGLFGAGLARPVGGAAAQAIAAANDALAPILAIDLPSGVSGLTGACLGEAVRAQATVTFFRLKPGHLLQPGRGRCGRTIVADIGIADEVLAQIGPKTFASGPALWQDRLAMPTDAGHKYDRGHAVVFSGGASKTGAARMAAMAALRGGAGLVTVFSPGDALLANAAQLTAIMLRRCDDVASLSEKLEDTRFNAFALGPGFGSGGLARIYAATVLGAGRRLVLDADGITSFQEDPEELFRCAKEAQAREPATVKNVPTGPRLVLTPHAGEFKRLFPDIAADESLSKLERARQAAERSGAVVVLKGRDTVIAAPDGRAAINATGTAWLATAGTGDVLTGLVTAQLAQGSPSFEAACAAVWMHGRAAELFGPGLIAEDLAPTLPRVFAELEDAEPARA